MVVLVVGKLPRTPSNQETECYPLGGFAEIEKFVSSLELTYVCSSRRLGWQQIPTISYGFYVVRNVGPFMGSFRLKFTEVMHDVCWYPNTEGVQVTSPTMRPPDKLGGAQ